MNENSSYNLPVELYYMIVWWCKSDYKTIANLLLLLPNLREYIKRYEKCREELKKRVSIKVNEMGCGCRRQYSILPNKKRYGKYKEWYKDGVLALRHNYKNGDLDGECKDWHNNGKLWMHRFFKEGKLNGEYKEWYNNGKLWIQRNYKNGDLHGECKEWWRRLYIRTIYKDGVELK